MIIEPNPGLLRTSPMNAVQGTCTWDTVTGSIDPGCRANNNNQGGCDQCSFTLYYLIGRWSTAQSKRKKYKFRINMIVTNLRKKHWMWWFDWMWLDSPVGFLKFSWTLYSFHRPRCARMNRQWDCAQTEQQLLCTSSKEIIRTQFSWSI